MTFSTRICAMLAAAAAVVHAAPALAGDATAINLPGPGVLSVIAAGIVGAVAVARLRK
jgi:hypothetical protein